MLKYDKNMIKYFLYLNKIAIFVMNIKTRRNEKFKKHYRKHYFSCN